MKITQLTKIFPLMFLIVFCGCTANVIQDYSLNNTSEPQNVVFDEDIFDECEEISVNIDEITIDFQNDTKEEIACFLFNQKYGEDYIPSDFSVVSVSKAGNDTIFELFCVDSETGIEFRANYSLTKQKIYDEYAQVLLADELSQIENNAKEISEDITDAFFKYEITDDNYLESNVNEYLKESDTYLVIDTGLTVENATDLIEEITEFSKKNSVKIVLRLADDKIIINPDIE